MMMPGPGPHSRRPGAPMTHAHAPHPSRQRVPDRRTVTATVTCQADGGTVTVTVAPPRRHDSDSDPGGRRRGTRPRPGVTWSDRRTGAGRPAAGAAAPAAAKWLSPRPTEARAAETQRRAVSSELPAAWVTARRQQVSNSDTTCGLSGLTRGVRTQTVGRSECTYTDRCSVRTQTRKAQITLSQQRKPEGCIRPGRRR